MRMSESRWRLRAAAADRRDTSSSSSSRTSHGRWWTTSKPVAARHCIGARRASSGSEQRRQQAVAPASSCAGEAASSGSGGWPAATARQRVGSAATNQRRRDATRRNSPAVAAAAAGERRRGCDAMNGAVARCRPVGCAISSTRWRSRVSGAQIETRARRFELYCGSLLCDDSYLRNFCRLSWSTGKRVMVTVYLRYELLSGRRRYLPIECTLGALIRVRRYLIVARVRVGRHGARPNPKSAGIFPRLNDLLVGTPCYLASLIDGLFTVLYIHAFIIPFVLFA
ncbi:hypothetical protein Scep_004009 [Stephania cephalantha]|uniref:Uncharacterized protein n=1 Tax=Stephania cephalantha TaxID=152367 RepID=A0AAP0PWA3_9MAGN